MSEAQITAFTDTWQWGMESEAALKDMALSEVAPQATNELMVVLPNFVGLKTPMRAYLTMMAIRLIELRRTLKATGSIYLHCDSTASHYLKILMDTIFGPTIFRNEIIWRRTSSHNMAYRYGPIHDTLLYYSKSDGYYFKTTYRPLTKGHVEQYFKNEDETGKYWTNSLTGAGIRHGESGAVWKGYDPTAHNRHWAMPGSICEELGIPEEWSTLQKLDELLKYGAIELPDEGSKAMPTYKQYLGKSPGIPLQDIWAYQPYTKGLLYESDEAIDEDVRWLNKQGDPERTGYETQKPLGLLTRILRSSCPEDGVIMDPFCGCGTAVVAAEKLKRKWIGIDITYLAIGNIKWRLEQICHSVAAEHYVVVGEPKDLEGAKALASQDKYQFQWWAVGLIHGQPYGNKKKGADTGIDGYLYYMDEKDKLKKAIVSIKGGANVSVTQIRDLAAGIAREKGDIGIFLTLEPPTKPMTMEAAVAGFYHSPLGKDYPKIQILTVEDALHGKMPDVPPWITPLPKVAAPKNIKQKSMKLL